MLKICEQPNRDVDEAHIYILLAFYPLRAGSSSWHINTNAVKAELLAYLF